MPKQQQGQQANKNGKWLEEDVAGKLRQCGYQQRLSRPSLAIDQTPFFIRGYSGDFLTIYHTSMNVDFFVWHPVRHPQGLIIELKYQEVGGTVDEKYPFLIASLKRQSIPALLLLIGNGMRAEALSWAKAQQDDALMVMTDWNALLAYTNKGLL